MTGRQDGNDAPRNPNQQQLEIPFDRSDYRERLISNLPIDVRSRELLLAIDRLVSDKGGVREGGIALLEASVLDVASAMGRGKRTANYLIARLRTASCPYLSVDQVAGRPNLFTLHFGPMIDDSRTLPSTTPAENARQGGLQSIVPTPARCGPIAGVQGPKIAGLQGCKNWGLQSDSSSSSSSSSLDPQIKKDLKQEKKETESRADRPPRREPSAGDVELAREMLSLIRERLPGLREPRLDKWADEFRLTREQDCRSVDEIRVLLEWIFKDPACWFGWPAAILSPSNLRKHWDAIESQRVGSRAGGSLLRNSGQFYSAVRRPGDGVL